ncbi:MAG: hypothetical protein Q8K89_07775 [Actinomycetota bacterium]|nr:hypothetical protein [Actinomycetota bacterium]
MSEPMDPKEMARLLAASTELKEYFADNLQVMSNPYSLNMVFGTLDINGNPRPEVSVRMSPQHAKVMCALVKKHILAYEKNIGAITLPDTLIRELDLEDVI